MNTFLSRIEKTISNVKDSNLRYLLLSTYKSAIDNEQKKVKNCKIFRKNGQSSGIDVEKTYKRINDIFEPPVIEKE